MVADRKGNGRHFLELFFDIGSGSSIQDSKWDEIQILVLLCQGKCSTTVPVREDGEMASTMIEQDDMFISHGVVSLFTNTSTNETPTIN